jgi:hypothetical protein
VAQVAVRTARVVVCALVIPIANDTRGEDQERDKRKRYSEYANRLLHSVFGRPKPGDRPLEY